MLQYSVFSTALVYFGIHNAELPILATAWNKTEKAGNRGYRLHK